MDKNFEVIMGWVIGIGVPLLILHIQDSMAARKERRNFATQQQRRDQYIGDQIDALKSTLEASSRVLENVRDDVGDIRERLARVETKTL